MSRRSVVLAVVAVAMLLRAGEARAGEVAIAPDRDCWIYHDYSDCAGDTLLAGNWEALETRWWDALLHFDVAGSVPSGATITSAKLHLFKVGGPAVPLSTFGMATAWTNAASPSSPDGIGAWSDGDLEHYDHENASATVDVDADDTWYEWDVTSITEFWTTPADNTGILLTQAYSGGAGSASEFASREAASHHPYLEVHYATGAPPTLQALSHSSAPPASAVSTFTDDVTATATDFALGVKSLTLHGLIGGDVTYEAPCATAAIACPATLSHAFHVDATQLHTGTTNSLSVTASGAGDAVSAARTFSVPLSPSCQQTSSCANASELCPTADADGSAGGGSASPTVSSQGDTLVASGTTVDTTISKNPENGVMLQSDQNAVCFTPVDVAPQAAPAQVVNSGSTVNFENTAPATSTQIVPTADGAETFDTIKSGHAPEDYSWQVTLADDQQLVAGSDGSVSVVDTNPAASAPTPAPTAPVDPADIPSLKASGQADPDSEAPDATATAKANNAVATSGPLQLPAPAANGDTSAAQAAQAAANPPSEQDTVLGEQPLEGNAAALPPSATPPPGLTQPADGTPLPGQITSQVIFGTNTSTNDAHDIASQQVDAMHTEVDADNEGEDNATAAAAVDAPATVTVAVMQAPTATDAHGAPVPTTLTVDGDTVTMHVEHRDEGYAYPIVADPWVRVNDYRWVDHCCHVVYGWQPRSHQEWRFDYIGSYFGWYLIHTVPSYYWGKGHDGRSLYAVWANGRWVLVHNEDWSGVFIPVLITVQDPPVRVITGYEHWWTYDYVGSHLEFHFDPDKDCVIGQPIVAECFGDQANVDDNGAHTSNVGPDAYVAPKIVRQYEPILHILPADPFIPMDFLRSLDFSSPSGVRTQLKGPGHSPISHPSVNNLLSSCAGPDCYLDFPADQDKTQMANLARGWGGAATSIMHAGASNPDTTGWQRPIVYFAVGGTPDGFAIQYWLFYAYNYFQTAIGEQDKHEGDWESVTVVVGKTGLPTRVRFSAHKNKTRSFSFSALQAPSIAPPHSSNPDTANGKYNGNMDDGLGGGYSNHVRTWVASGDHANLPACGGGFDTDVPVVGAAAKDHSCDGMNHLSTLTFISRWTLMQRLNGAVWCWRGEAGDGEGPRMPLTTNQQNPISDWTGGAPLHC